MQISVICHFWSLWNLQCWCYQVDTPSLQGHIWVAAGQQLQGQLHKAVCLNWGCSLLWKHNCCMCFQLAKARRATNIHFLVYDIGESRAEKGWWQRGNSIYLTFDMFYRSSYLEKLKVVDLWLKCLSGLGVLLAKSLKWGLRLCDSISYPLLAIASPILDHV